MNLIHFHKLGAATEAALMTGNHAALVAAIVTVQHRGRLQRLFRQFALRFLEAYAESKAYPASRHAAKRVRRAKAALDLIRARLFALGGERPTDTALLDWAREADLPRMIPLRKAA